jgi:hypothetical protein
MVRRSAISSTSARVGAQSPRMAIRGLFSLLRSF